MEGTSDGRNIAWSNTRTEAAILCSIYFLEKNRPYTLMKTSP